MTVSIDPTRPTDERLKRGTFVVLSAAAAVATTVAHAEAAGLTRIAENDPQIVAEHTQVSTDDGTIGAYVAAPRDASAKTPGIVLVMHVWGVDDTIRDGARRLAKAGFNVVAPNLFARFGAPSGDGLTDYTIIRPFSAKLDRKQYNGDIVAAARYLTERSKAKIGITGFCLGGRVALEQTIDNPSLFSASAPFYGAVKDIDPSRVTTPICGSYGERDTSIPPDGVRAFFAALKVPNEVKIYDEAGHAFCDEDRGSYVPSAAVDAWARTIAFLRAHVGEAS
jgi:carboxymethylenebutenolidase